LEYPIDLWTSSFPESRAKKLGYEFQKNYGCILVFFAFSRYKYLKRPAELEESKRVPGAGLKTL
jgi:hypothetical protein